MVTWSLALSMEKESGRCDHVFLCYLILVLVVSPTESGNECDACTSLGHDMKPVSNGLMCAWTSSALEAYVLGRIQQLTCQSCQGCNIRKASDLPAGLNMKGKFSA